MERKELIKKYIEFFKSKKHSEIANASLIPVNDPTVLFTTAGMHPLVPFILGEKHPSGKKLVGVQRCIRTGDIDEVGDDFHNTFFEMLGNWSLGDYWKKESIAYSIEFLTKVLGFEKEKIAVTCFEGSKSEKIPRDEDAASAWRAVGIANERIFFLGKKDNWWGPAGKTGPCGPDTEIFFDTGKRKCSSDCSPGCNCGKYVEIWNNVFMQYNKKDDGSYVELKQKTVDTGMGVERTVAMINNRKSIFENPDFKQIINSAGLMANPNKLDARALKIIADHLRASVFILAEKIAPGNVEQGYVLRRLIRRAVRYASLMGINENFTKKIAEIVIGLYNQDYSLLEKNKEFIMGEIDREEEKFRRGLEKGINLFNKLSKENKKISGKDAFLLYQSYGFPIELTNELAKENKISVDMKEYEEENKKHKELSQTASAGRFKSGLADHGEMTTKYHTASHLLLEALNRVLGQTIEQRGSNINAERARFDFSFDRKLDDNEIKKVEELVNSWISKGFDVERVETDLEGARKLGARGIFEDKYKGVISVYLIDKGKISKEICTGPHVKSLKELQGFNFRISEQSSVGAGARRIKAVLEKK